MEFELKQTFNIESARYLSKLPAGHPCARIHGHSFKIQLRLVGPLEDAGWVIDYNEIESRVRPILQIVDHRLLNEVEGLANPTSEVLCAWLFDKIKNVLPQLIQVTVAETPNTECSYPARIK